MEESTIKEGLVTVRGKDSNDKTLFYNPPQVLNRDLSLIVLKTFIEQEKEQHDERNGEFVGVNVLEMLAATGIRGLRYKKELGDLVRFVVFNDLDRNSAESIKVNAEMNGVTTDQFRVICADANLLANVLTPQCDVMRIMLMPGGIMKIPCGFNPSRQFTLIDQFNEKVDGFLNLLALSPLESEYEYRNVIDAIDVDPYSSASGFLDSTLKCVKSGGIVLITSTDMPTLCGNNPLVSFYKYGGSSIKASFCHELSLRILLNSIATTASKYQRVIEPLISCSIDFYVRVFVKVTYNPEMCKRVASNSGLLLLCSQCDSFEIMKLGEYEQGTKQKPASVPSNFSGKCRECGGRIKIGGPLYTGKLHNFDFVTRCLKEAKEAKENLPGVSMHAKIVGLLTSISEELEDVPLFYSIPDLCQRWNLSTISPSIFKGALENLGYKSSHFHRKPQSLKTDAPNKVVMDIIRTHAQMSDKVSDHPFFKTKIETEGIDLTISRKEKRSSVPRWIPNPTSHWGPKKMHKSVASSLVYDEGTENAS
ncbi:N2,N2-dimethylguanosine tRNA methyltransferase, putative [Theileria equi strain WA]|uniref:tRNA (guanine(26)-N(2))-dimethyltransferase n=1 Tax=Theileria equi strain WA TaxID=1537102 RepID=L0AWP7_THEEQ|nr:N2,N2-dimethylguanosine tRNA methyltransferase, putative [Theileria equi strain WA]AFZ79436.1 N2,N2-dimethylguanosine tRNA methyltransferase, putative [Theileria equi strain WA]|eukprot:XP_004829102.1 N2,N2-dimethylguanosine tRNA methyltransferase, putative [Theileria equi strain WA]